MNFVTIAGSAESIYLILNGNLRGNCTVFCEGLVQPGGLPGGGTEGGDCLVFWVVLIVTLTDS